MQVKVGFIARCLNGNGFCGCRQEEKYENPREIMNEEVELFHKQNKVKNDANFKKGRVDRGALFGEGI